MTMSLAALEILEQAQFPSAQARAIARIFEAEVANRYEQLIAKADLKTELEAFATKAELKGELTSLKADLEVKIEGVKTDCLRWTFLMMVGQMTLLTGIMYFMLKNLR